MMRTTDLAHLMMKDALKPGDWALDATVGNGHDTAFLADLVGPSGRVFGFDVQAEAIAATATRVEEHSQVSLFHAGHETLADHLPEDARLAGVMFNLGYLPGAAHEIMTHADTTIDALEQVLARMKSGGLITLMLYPGHSGGDVEAEAVRSFVDKLGSDYAVAQYRRLNPSRPAPELLAIKRMRESVG